MTHTPGPWANIGNSVTSIDHGTRYTIAKVGNDKFIAEANAANARLIAAAPDMLHTLRDIVRMLTNANDMRANALHAARIAITKATGGAA